jgi:glutamine amidotransferase
VVRGWPDSVADLAARLPVRDLMTLDAPTDSALLWLLVRDRLRRGEDLGKALQDTVSEVIAAAPGSRLNLLLTDGHTLAATTLGHALSIRRRPDSVLLSSEPLDDDPAWTAVPDGRLVVASLSTVDISLLPNEVRVS